MNISIRPNLNKKGFLTAHDGRLGKKLGHFTVATIRCSATVVRPAGQKKAEEGKGKTVHAALIGEPVKVVYPSDSSPLVESAPHKGDTTFHIGGVPYYGGGIVTMVAVRKQASAETLKKASHTLRVCQSKRHHHLVRKVLLLSFAENEQRRTKRVRVIKILRVRVTSLLT